ncbi:hypothetical protein PNA2_1911 [Pyrococcus sp. NA2]|uniref:hypothetical protein n=1 Tax=Pyrococcus sp. (strain NA2) TaxID=342949 RepID=UPI000209AD83|nr:hypothetical protein [Pyrococcus sp. NA2]AEC52825.1 hypothetical protein PNA2_1911 [Pyrococcus sp. NA2]
MRKVTISLILAIILVEALAPITFGEEKYSELTTVGLKLGWSIKFAQRYVVKLQDVDESWSKVKIKVYENGNPTATYILSEGEMGYYPDKSNVILRIKVTGIWKDKETVYVKIGTPLKLIEDNLVLEKGESYTVPSPFLRYRIKVIEIPSNSEAKVEVTYPTGKKVTRMISKTSPLSIPYKISNDLTQSPYIMVELVSAKEGKEVVLDIYGAKLTFQGVQILKSREESKQETQEVGEISQEIYSGLLYEGETLTIEYNDTRYGIRLLSVGYYSRFEVLDKKGQRIESFSVREGSSYQLKKIPFRIEIPPNSIDLIYNRTYIRVFGPLEASAMPIIREAKVVAELYVNQKKVLLNGDELIVFIKVRNIGKGNAFQVKVLAPVPNDFELRSGIGTWTLNTLEAYSEMPVLVYTLKPNRVGTYNLGPVIVEYYNEAGKKVTVKSNSIEKIEVYGIPEIKLEVKGLKKDGSWGSYITGDVNSTIRLRFRVSAIGENEKYEFIKNASIVVNIGDFLDGKEVLQVGDLKAGDEKIIESQYLILREGIHRVSATLVYQDPLGNWHRIDYPNVVIINSIPPKVIVKKEVVEKWPEPSQLPEYIDVVLSKLSNPTPLAEEIKNVSLKYIPKSTDSTKIFLGTMSLILGVGLVVAVYYTAKYKNELERLKLKKKKPRPGGLPKKESSEAEKEETTSTS